MNDLLFELTQWLYTTPLNAFAQGVSESRMSEMQDRRRQLADRVATLRDLRDTGRRRHAVPG